MLWAKPLNTVIVFWVVVKCKRLRELSLLGLDSPMIGHSLESSALQWLSKSITNRKYESLDLPRIIHRIECSSPG